MSYDPKGKSFVYEGVQYCLGVAEDELGMRTCALFYKSGAQWLAALPVFNVNLTNAEIMKHGSVAAYLVEILPKAEAMLRSKTIPEKPDAADKAMCLAYDMAIDVDFDPVTQTFRINKSPPLSHAR